MPSASLPLSNAYTATGKKSVVRGLQRIPQTATSIHLINHQAAAYLLAHRHSKPQRLLQSYLASLIRLCRAHHYNTVMYWPLWDLHTLSSNDFGRKRESDHVCECRSDLVIAVLVHRVREMGSSFLNPLGNRRVSIAHTRTNTVRGFTRYSSMHKTEPQMNFWLVQFNIL